MYSRTYRDRANFKACIRLLGCGDYQNGYKRDREWGMRCIRAACDDH